MPTSCHELSTSLTPSGSLEIRNGKCSKPLCKSLEPSSKILAITDTKIITVTEMVCYPKCIPSSEISAGDTLSSLLADERKLHVADINY